MTVYIRLFGMLQLDSGFSQAEVEARNVDEAFAALLELIRQRNSCARTTLEDMENCVLMINGKQSTKNAELHDGDQLYFMSPVHGG